MNQGKWNLTKHDIQRTDHNLSRPEEVVNDPLLSADEKRAVLAAWASDAHAVPDEPTLRQLDNGAIVSLSAVLDGLKELDVLRSFEVGKALGYHDQRHDEILTKWRKRSPWRRRRRDDDDEPPPVPAAVSVRSCNPAWA